MKNFKWMLLAISLVGFISACNKVNYRKTKSGIVYKLYPSNSKDSIAKNGQVVKFQVTTKLNDSVMYNSYDKMPAFARLSVTVPEQYNIMAVLAHLKKGDSAVMIQLMDTLIKLSGAPPAGKKGDRVITTIRVLDVFKDDSLAMADYRKESEKDRPRQLKEQEAQEAKAMKELEVQEAAAYSAMEKSGELAREFKEIDDYLKQHNISAQKVGKGTYVQVNDKGTGPVAAVGKFVNVKYSGKFLSTDSVFQANSYEFPLGKRAVIRGWDEGLQLFGLGGKGTLYVPGFLAYGQNPPPGSPFKPNEALKFDVEMLSISDTPTVRRREGMR